MEKLESAARRYARIYQIAYNAIADELGEPCGQAAERGATWFAGRIVNEIYGVPAILAGMALPDEVD